MRTSIAIFTSLVVLALAGSAQAAPLLQGAPVPELDPQAGGAAFLLLAGAIASLTARRRRTQATQ
jgi:hypothetical protein